MNMDGPLKGVREEVPLTHIVPNVTQNIKKKKLFPVWASQMKQSISLQETHKPEITFERCLIEMEGKAGREWG